MRIILLYILLGLSLHLKAQIGPKPILEKAANKKTEIYTKIGRYWVSYNKDSLIESKGKRLVLQGRKGKWTFYHLNGKKKEVGKYKNGIRVGKWKFYNENGELVKKEVY